MNKIQEKLISGGYCDERGVGFAANAELLPNGSYGIVLLCLKGNELTIYDTDMQTNPGRVIIRIPLKEAEGLKVKGLLIKSLKFKYRGFEYCFKNLLGLNAQLEIIAGESRG